MLGTVLASTSACDQANYIEGVVRWDSRDGQYGLQYVTPPWEVESDDGVELRLRISAELFGVGLKGSPPTHVFSIGEVDPERAIEDLLPQGLADAETDSAFDFDFDTTGMAPADSAQDSGDETSSWTDIDLGSPQQVALAELDRLITHEHADLILELGRVGGPTAPWTYEVVIAPGLFVRAYYYRDGERTIRAVFASLFTLTDGDVSTMAATITVGDKSQ